MNLDQFFCRWKKQVIILCMGITLTACGRQDSMDTASRAEVHPVAVAGCYDMDLPVPLDQFYCYAVVGDRLYLADGRWDRTQGQLGRVFRCHIGKEFQWEPYLTRGSTRYQVVMADREGNCILFAADIEDEKFPYYLLEKYDAEGELLWSREYTAETLADGGENLTEGILTESGRIWLYGFDGTSGRVLSFDREGMLEKIYHPKLEVLQGVVEGADEQPYGYSITEEKVRLEALESGEEYVCSLAADSVHSGCQEGIYLCSDESLWCYDPVNNVLKEKWKWDEEYVNVDGSQVLRIWRDGEAVRLLCHVLGERSASGNRNTRLSFATVTIESSRDYPGKEIITLGNVYGQQNGNSHVEELVRLYNRQSVKYYVELLPYELADDTCIKELEQQLLRSEGPDLLDVAWMYAGHLVTKGVFEDLTEYYRSSSVVSEKDIFPAVLKACHYAGQNVFVIPGFSIGGQLSNVELAPEDWTPWKYLELAEEGPMYRFPSRRYDLQQCMGLNYTEHFVDYEKQECFFDNEEFRQILMACARGQDVEMPQTYTPDAYPDVDYVLESNIFPIRGMQDYLLLKASYGENVYPVGYPGWSGAEYQMQVSDIFAINHASQHKEGAWDFLEYLLSAELQEKMNWEFPVREDKLEHYIQTSYAAAREYSDLFSYQEIGYTPGQKDLNAVWEMLERAVYGHMERDNPIIRIVLEEADMYFQGDADLEDTVNKIQSRVQLYLEE